MNPAAIAAALKLYDLRKKFEPAYIKFYHAVKPKEDGTFLYTFQAQFKTEAEAEAFKAFCIESEKLEGMM